LILSPNQGSVSSSKGKQNPVKILFPSIPFEKPLVGLYFAASWCDDSVAANPAVAKFHGTHQDILDIVYVASDQSQKEMDGFAPATFVKIPFENVKERTQLKQHFAVCAAKEREALKIDKRKHGIPTLIVLDSVTGAVITTDGIVDVTETPEKAVEKWSSRTP
jgi:thiol-disulfide isomerase/thioredoxin